MVDCREQPAFLDKLWGVAPHHIGRNQGEYFEGLPTGTGELLAALHTEPSAVRLVRGADHLDPEHYTLVDGTLDQDVLRSTLTFFVQ